MTAKEIFENYYNELSQLERDIYTTSDNSINEFYFNSIKDYKEFCAGFNVAMEWKRGDLI